MGHLKQSFYFIRHNKEKRILSRINRAILALTVCPDCKKVMPPSWGQAYTHCGDSSGEENKDTKYRNKVIPLLSRAEKAKQKCLLCGDRVKFISNMSDYIGSTWRTSGEGVRILTRPHFICINCYPSSEYQGNDEIRSLFGEVNKAIKLTKRKITLEEV